MRNDILKTLAQKAKDRMRTGYNEDEGKRLQVKKRLSSDFKIRVISDGVDDKFYTKVIEVLKNEEYCLSPIKLLINESVYNSLDNVGKEHYFFDTLEKYNKCKQKYEKECCRVI